MNVLQSVVRYPPDVGGVERHVQGLSKGLDAQGHDVRVVCGNRADGGATRETVEGIDVRRLRSPLSIANTDVTPALPATIVRAARDVDLIHTHLPTPWTADVSAVVGRVAGTPVVLTHHNDVTGDGLARYLARAYSSTAMRLTLGCTDRVIITQPDYYRTSTQLSVPRSKVVTIPNGVDVDQFRQISVPEGRRAELGFSSDRPNLLFLSVLDEFHEYKGLDVLLQAMSALSEEPGQTPHLVVGGEGDLRGRYERLAATLGLDGSVTFVGYVPEPDLVEAYAAADAVVLPSTSSVQEGFGLVLLEALACGTPVVATSVVGIASDVCERDVGRIVEPGDPAELAGAIRDLLGGDRAGMAERGRSLCLRKYAWSQIAADVGRVYADVTGYG